MSRFAWYVDFPLSQYREDVRQLARENGLIVLDARNQGAKKQASHAPKLTLKKEPVTPPVVPVSTDVTAPVVADANADNTENTDSAIDQG